MMPGEDLVVNNRVVISADELEWRFSASGGPGGQHVNTSNTRVELVFDVAASTSLSPNEARRVIEALGPVVRVVARDQRSQLRNRELARERLAERLAAALTEAAPRRATRPTRGSVERRIAEKRVRARRKADRRPPSED